MNAIEMEIGIFHFFSVLLAALNQDFFSWKILHTSLVEEGGLEAQEVTKNKKRDINKKYFIVNYERSLRISFSERTFTFKFFALENLDPGFSPTTI